VKASWLVAGLIGVAVGWGGHALWAHDPVRPVPPATAPAAPAPTVATPGSIPVRPITAPRADPAPASCPEELARTRAELEKHLTAPEKFERGAPNPDGERRIAAELDRVLKDKTASHALECRGQVCKLDVLEHRDHRGDWMDPLQSDDQLLRLASGRSFGNTKPVKDPVSGEPMIHSEAYLQLVDPDEVSGLDLLRSAYKAFRAGGDVAACGRRFPSVTGDLDLAVTVENGPGFTVETGGTLAMTDAGNCLESALRAALARVALPEHVSPGVLHAQLKLP
jgi:hypothetical protein